MKSKTTLLKTIIQEEVRRQLREAGNAMYLPVKRNSREFGRYAEATSDRIGELMQSLEDIIIQLQKDFDSDVFDSATSTDQINELDDTIGYFEDLQNEVRAFDSKFSRLADKAVKVYRKIF